MKVIFKLLMQFIVSVTNLFLLPINTIVSTYFPSFNDFINRFNSYVGQLLTPLLRYFFNILPTNCRYVIIAYLSMLIVFYTASFAIHGVIKVIEIIKNIKVW